MDKRQAWYQGWPVFVEKGIGPGRGWWGPPKGTHGPGSLGGQVGRTAKQVRAELKQNFERRKERAKQLREKGDELAKQWGDIAERQHILGQRLIARTSAGLDTSGIKKDIDKANQEFDRIHKQLTENERTYWDLKQHMREAARERLKVDTPAVFDVNFGQLRKGKEPVQEGANGFANLVGTGALDGQTVRVGRPTYYGRAREYYSQDMIHMTTRSSTKTTVHELGHWLEDKDPVVHGKALDFLAKRTKGERAVSLRSVTGNPAYRRHEVCKKDKFMSPYMGKQYEGGYATEIVSMGLEYMYAQPVEFATQDPGYFDFVYDLMRGE